jgi:hypothetical protein
LYYSEEILQFLPKANDYSSGQANSQQGAVDLMGQTD